MLAWVDPDREVALAAVGWSANLPSCGEYTRGQVFIRQYEG